MDIESLPQMPDPAPSVMTVSALNQAVGRMLERQFPLMWVSGEISNFTKAASGHWYFSLKDAAAQVRAVMFRGRAQYADFIPREGDKVEVRALVTLYAARGDFQLSVEAIRRAGVGNLYEAFLRLKQKLEAEGLFAAARKRALPYFVRTVGIVTSLQAAALRDVLTTLQRRAPHVRVVLYPTPVQGQGAAAKIVSAISTASRRAECDILLVCRGGGSIEDLWSFNDEAVARAIAACSMPVVVGVGHETDFTIADFAADLRAPTPTAAAELAAAPRQAWLGQLHKSTTDLTRAMQRQLREQRQSIDWLGHRLKSPAAVIRHEQLKLAGLQARLGHALTIPVNEARHALRHLRGRLQHALPNARASRSQLADLQRRLDAATITQQARLRLQLASLAGQLSLLDPQRTLERGYAMVIDHHGAIVRSPQQLHARETVRIRLADGAAAVGIASVQAALPG